MLAKKVETREEFSACQKAGFSYFQGYFFRKPEILHAREIPKNQANYLRLLQAISRDEIEFTEIDSIIKGEASLCYRLLRYLNSAAFGFASEIHSVRHGLSILGEREVRRWVRMVAALGAGQDKPSDLVLSAMVRARYCELLGPKIPHGESDLFLVGLLSLMDAILELPMGVVLEGITLDRETRAVLLGQKSQLDPVYRLMLSQEAADWPKLSELCAQMKLPEGVVTECHWKAMQWARGDDGSKLTQAGGLSFLKALSSSESPADGCCSGFVRRRHLLAPRRCLKMRTFVRARPLDFELAHQVLQIERHA